MHTLHYIFFVLIFTNCSFEEKSNKQSQSRSKKILKVNNQLKEINRLYYVDLFSNVNYLNPGINNIDLADDYLQIIDEKYKISYFLKEGEEIKINSQNGFLKIESGNEIRDNEFRFSTELYQKKDYKDINLWLPQLAKLESKYYLNPKIRELEFRKELDERLDFLNKYSISNQVSDEFKVFYENILKYRFLDKQLFFGNQLSKFPDIYINKLYSNSKKYFQSDKFLFLDTYRSAILSHSNLNVNLKSIQGKLSEFEKNYATRIVQWVIMHNIFTEKGPYPYFNYDKSEIDSLETYLYKSRMPLELKEYYENTKVLEDTVLQETELVDTNFKKSKLLETINDRITYVDFWASWCAPCRAEMPASKKLSQEYSSKGINFIYLSIDENPAAWLKANNQIGLSNSFLLPKGINSIIGKKFDMKSVPRYVIFDKNGKLISKDAPRPTDPKLKEIFDKLLKVK